MSKPFAQERRRTVDHTAGDQLTKQMVILTLCACAALFAATVCWLALHAMEVPDPLDRLATFVIGNLSGVLAKTGVDKFLGSDETPAKVEVTNTEANRVPVDEAPKDNES